MLQNSQSAAPYRSMWKFFLHICTKATKAEGDDSALSTQAASAAPGKMLRRILSEAEMRGLPAAWICTNKYGWRKASAA